MAFPGRQPGWSGGAGSVALPGACGYQWFRQTGFRVRRLAPSGKVMLQPRSRPPPSGCSRVASVIHHVNEWTSRLLMASCASSSPLQVRSPSAWRGERHAVSAVATLIGGRLSQQLVQYEASRYRAAVWTWTVTTVAGATRARTSISSRVIPTEATDAAACAAAIGHGKTSGGRSRPVYDQRRCVESRFAVGPCVVPARRSAARVPGDEHDEAHDKDRCDQKASEEAARL